MYSLLFLIALLPEFAPAADYYGTRVARIVKPKLGLDGTVYLASASMVQIEGFQLDPQPGERVYIYFSNAEESTRADAIYRVSADGRKAHALTETTLDAGISKADLVIPIPGGNYADWDFIGVVSEDSWKFLAAARLNNRQPPEPYCCLPALKGQWYNAGSGRITVLDEKTLKIPNFTFEGDKPPDGWIYLGSGEVNRNTGKKALIVGRDTPAFHTPLRQRFSGDEDITVRLAEGQTIYGVDYLSVYCFAVGVDFGRINFKLNANSDRVPPVLPELVTNALSSDPQIVPWARPILVARPIGSQPTDLTFALGPPGGKRAQAMRSIADDLDHLWYVQGKMTPEIWVQRGHIYRLKVHGGAEHPLYLSSDESGGWVKKPESEIDQIDVFAGGDGTAIGTLCEYVEIDDPRAQNPDDFVTFDEYRHFLHQRCETPKNSFSLTWVPSILTPDTVYYGSYNEYNMGGAIRVCDEIQGTNDNPHCA